MATDSLGLAARQALLRQGYSFDWFPSPDKQNTVCQLYDEGGYSVTDWEAAGSVPDDARLRVECGLAREHLEETGALRAQPDR